LVSVGIECTGSYGAAVTGVVREAGIEVFVSLKTKGPVALLG